MQNGLESCIIVPPPEQMPLDIKKLLRKKSLKAQDSALVLNFSPIHPLGSC